MATEYEKALRAYRELSQKGPDAKAERARVHQDVLAIEKQASREGKYLEHRFEGDKLVVNVREGNSRRSLQEEYVRKFDDESEVKINGEVTTLRKYHSRRLLGK